MGLSSRIPNEETADALPSGIRIPTQVKNCRAKARLVSVYPVNQSIVIDLDDSPLRLGRSAQNPSAPPISHRTVSRAHFQIEWNPRMEVHIVRDLGSRNGSSLDGVPLTSGWQKLNPGSVLRIGDVLLIYELCHTLEILDAPQVSQEAAPGQAQCIRALRDRMHRAALDISPVLIMGETGTGKEQLAREVHRLSGRSGEFVAVNCATFGEQLIESQLFGHLKGAFTGASSDNPGLFRAAHLGTLFLDEIGEMPLELQPKLLRAIQEGEVRPIGAAEAHKVDVRIVAATHRSLAHEAHKGTFRQDLFARLGLWQLEVPSIRERRVDILFWLHRLHQIWAQSRQITSKAFALTPQAAEQLLLAPWHENIRGLDRLVHELATIIGSKLIYSTETNSPYFPTADLDRLPSNVLSTAPPIGKEQAATHQIDVSDLPSWIRGG